jgi:hypothetical protein
MIKIFIKKYLIVTLSLLAIIVLTILKIYSVINFYSDGILIVTALIILWYTFETATIAKISEENQLRLKSPSVFCYVYTNPQDSSDTKIKLSNQSTYPVAVKLNCNFKMDGKDFDFSPAYNGQHYWNLQYNEIKEGHFSWLDLLKHQGIISSKEANIFRKLRTKELVPDPPNLSMDIEIYCINEMGIKGYYPPIHYDYNYHRSIWIPILTSEKPFWEFDSEPSWTSNKDN